MCRKNAKILRSFSMRCRFRFDSGGEYLLVQNSRTIYLIELRTNAMTELFTNDYCHIDAFAFSPDGNHAYVSEQRCTNASTVYKIDIKTREVQRKIIAPVQTYEIIAFNENKLTILGKRYDTHIESCDGHELFDEYSCRFTIDLITDEHYLEPELDERDYHSAVRAVEPSARSHALPKDIQVYTYQNDQTEFWDDTVYYELYIGKRKLQILEKDVIPDYVGVQEGFGSFSLIRHEAYTLLIGYSI